MGRYALILVVGFGLIIGIIKIGMNRTGSQAGELTAGHNDGITARNAANSVAQLCLYHLSQDDDWNDGYANLHLNSAIVNATITELDDEEEEEELEGLEGEEGEGEEEEEEIEDLIRIQIEATCGVAAASVQVLVGQMENEWPAAVDAGITARCNVSTLGNMLIDGRDHDWNGNLIVNNGVEAISTMQSFSRGGNSQVAGTTDAGADIAPTKTGWADIVDQSAPWPDGYPATPDQVLGGAAHGYSEGILKSVAQIGDDGSQYVTNPALLHFPLHGVTYVELPSGSSWLPVNLGCNSEGILIVHNSAGNAVMKNINFGSFHGLIIADDLVHIHTQIIGAVFVLTAGPSEGNCIGNGSGSIIFSREAVREGIEESDIEDEGMVVVRYWE